MKFRLLVIHILRTKASFSITVFTALHAVHKQTPQLTLHIQSEKKVVIQGLLEENSAHLCNLHYVDNYDSTISPKKRGIEL